jgi:hypothetical protein
MEDSYGIWSWTIALVAWHSIANYHFARHFHASLKQLSAAGLIKRSN